MLLGGICSAATAPIAKCSQLLNLIQVEHFNHSSGIKREIYGHKETSAGAKKKKREFNSHAALATTTTLKRHTNFVQFETPASLKSHDVGEARFNGTARSAIEVNIYCCLLKLSSKPQIW